MKVVGIYLAAGNSRRMGENKLALPVGTMTLGSLALQTALKTSLDEIYIITKELEEVSWLPNEIIDNKMCTIVTCLTSHKGQSESLRCGIRQAQLGNADAAVVLLADQPFITVQMIDEMISCMKKTPTSKYVAASHEGRIMPPVLFSSSLFPALLNLTGDTGAKALLRGEFLHQGTQIPCNDNRLIFDVDTKEDYEELLSFLKN